MTRHQPLIVMRRRWAVIAAGIVLGLLVGWLSAPGTARSRPMYQATQTLLLDPGSAGTGGLINRVAVMATLGPVPGRVATRLGLTRAAVEAMVSAETRDNLGLVLVTGHSTDAKQAVALADVTSSELITQFGGPGGPLRSLEGAVATPAGTGDVEGPASRTGRALLLGLFGLVLGVGGALAVDRFDNRIRSPGVVEDALGVPVVAEVPAVPRSARGRLLTDGPSAFLEAHRRMATAVTKWKSPADDGHRVFVVTSPGPGEGRTATVVHLAAAVGETGRSVLVVSADLRRPDLYRWFDAPSAPGLTEILRGAPDVRAPADLERPTRVRGVRFLPAGAPVENPAPLLEAAGGVLADARNRFDVVLVDAPPLLVSHDAVVLAGHADGVLLVVRAGRTSVGAGGRGVETLERLGVPVVGAVLVGSGASRSSRPTAGGGS